MPLAGMEERLEALSFPLRFLLTQFSLQLGQHGCDACTVPLAASVAQSLVALGGGLDANQRALDFATVQFMPDSRAVELPTGVEWIVATISTPYVLSAALWSWPPA